MNNQPIKKRLIMFNFLKLMGGGVLLCIFIIGYIYLSSMSVVREQLIKSNEQKLEILRVSVDEVIEQTDRIAAALCVDPDAVLFYESKSPEKADSELWKRIAAKLKTYTFGIDYIDSIILYSDIYDRMICDSQANISSYQTVEPIDLQDARGKTEYDTDWIEYIPEANSASVLQKIRAVNNSYPYVLTLIKQFQRLGLTRTVIVNLDLRALYAALWASDMNDTQVFVLDGNGNIIISAIKSDLYGNIDDYPMLDQFATSRESKSILIHGTGTPYTYSQEYNEKYDMYFISCTALTDYQRLVRNEQLKVVSVFLVCMLVLCIVVFVYSVRSYRPFGHIIDLLDNQNLRKDDSTTRKDQIEEIVDKIVIQLQLNEDLKIELDNRLDLLKETQIQALQSQLDPHFIYNSLDAVGMMVEEIEGEKGKIGTMVQSLVDILRYSISGHDLVTFKTEKVYLQKYLYVLRCRYCDCFDIDFDFDEELSNLMIPKLTLQPLIENAVFHGIMGRKCEIGGKLSIQGHLIRHCFDDNGIEEEVVRVEVIDNGNGMQPKELEQLKTLVSDLEHVATSHIGVQNTAKRLYLLFPGQISFDIQSEYGVGTRISLTFPKLKNESEEG